MQKRNFILVSAGILGLLALSVALIPSINARLAWRFEVAKTYVRNVIHPVGAVPTAIAGTPLPATPTNQIAFTPTAAPSLQPSAVASPVPPTATLPPLPVQAALSSPPYEKQT